MCDIKKGEIMKRAFEKLVVSALIFSLCISIFGGVKSVWGYDENGSSNLYMLDDLRYLLGEQRVFDGELDKQLREEVGKLDLTDSQLAEAASVLGNVEKSFTTDNLRANHIKQLIANFNEGLANGYYPTILMDSYRLAKSALTDYEEEFGAFIVNDEQMATAVDEFIEKLATLKDKTIHNPEIGALLCTTGIAPIYTNYICESMETGEYGTTFVSNKDGADVTVMFNCTVTKIEEHDNSLCTVTTESSEALVIEYTAMMQVESDIKSKVDAGEKVELMQRSKIGKLNGKDGAITVAVRAFLDGEEFDILKVLGNDGASMKQKFISEHPERTDIVSLWTEISEGRMLSKMEPGEGIVNDDFEVEEGSIAAYYDDSWIDDAEGE